MFLQFLDMPHYTITHTLKNYARLVISSLRLAFRKVIVLFGFNNMVFILRIKTTQRISRSNRLTVIKHHLFIHVHLSLVNLDRLNRFPYQLKQKARHKRVVFRGEERRMLIAFSLTTRERHSN